MDPMFVRLLVTFIILLAIISCIMAVQILLLKKQKRLLGLILPPVLLLACLVSTRFIPMLFPEYITAIIIIIGIVELHVLLSKNKNKWLGFILPIAFLILSIVATVVIPMMHTTFNKYPIINTTNYGSVLSSILSTITILIAVNVITAILGVIYFSCRNEVFKKKVSSFLGNNAIVIFMVLVAVFVGISRQNFVSMNNFRNLAMNTSVRFIIALGVSGCLITKGTDLSAGRLIGLTSCIACTLLQKANYGSRFFPEMGQPNLFLIFLFVIVIGIMFGAINGSVIAFLKVPPFLSSLGMQTIVYGICMVYTGSKPIGGLRDDFLKVATGAIGPANGFNLPYLFLIALVLGGLMWFLYNKTRHGKYMYAIGGNESAAEVSGINTSKTKILIYMLAACLYGVAGILLAAKSGGASVNMGVGYELEAIAACTIGGVSTNGGVGKISGILVGVLVFELLKISLQFMGVETSYTYIVQGLVIIIAVALDLRKYLAKK